MKRKGNTYHIKEGWIFNLEAMHDKLWCLIYDLRDGNLTLPIQIAGTDINSEEDLYALQEESENLEWIAKSRKVTSKEYGRIKQLVNWRVEQRYATCLANGMAENQAGLCFDDL